MSCLRAPSFQRSLHHMHEVRLDPQILLTQEGGSQIHA